jgi:hypothetical protein
VYGEELANQLGTLATWKNSANIALCSDLTKHKFVLSIGPKTYVVWTAPAVDAHKAPIPGKQAINMQALGCYLCGDTSNKTGIIISDAGEIESVHIDSKPIIGKVIPADNLAVMKAAFRRSLEVSSKYGFRQLANGKSIPEIKVIQSGLKEVPEYHLSKLMEFFNPNSGSIQSFQDVKFLESNLQNAEVIDVGGVTRGYYNGLFEGLMNLPNYFVKAADSGFYKIPCQEELTGAQSSFYKNFGKLLMLAYRSGPPKDFTTGRNFDRNFFEAILSLSAEDIDKSFDQIPLKTLGIISQPFFPKDQNYSALTNVLLHVSLPMPTDLVNLKELGVKINVDGISSCGTVEDATKRIADRLRRILANTSHTYMGDDDALFGNSVDLNFLVLELKKHVIEYSRERGFNLEAVHTMAKGMKAFYYGKPDKNLSWNAEMFSIGGQAVNRIKAVETKIQGEINRGMISKGIIPKFQQNGQSIKLGVIATKRVKWIKDWITNKSEVSNQDGLQCSDEELQWFVRFVTGSNSTPPVPTFFVDLRSPSLTPSRSLASHTCFSRFDVCDAWDNSEKNVNEQEKQKLFIKTLKAAIKDNSFGMA